MGKTASSNGRNNTSATHVVAAEDSTFDRDWEVLRVRQYEAARADGKMKWRWK
jgi:hypothetical protein